MHISTIKFCITSHNAFKISYTQQSNKSNDLAINPAQTTTYALEAPPGMLLSFVHMCCLHRRACYTSYTHKDGTYKKRSTKIKDATVFRPVFFFFFFCGSFVCGSFKRFRTVSWGLFNWELYRVTREERREKTIRDEDGRGRIGLSKMWIGHLAEGWVFLEDVRRVQDGRMMFGCYWWKFAP